MGEDASAPHDTNAEVEAADRALLDQALKKGALVWLYLEAPAAAGGAGPAARGHGRWHVWADGNVYLLTGEGEQPDPGLVVGATVRVAVRSKDNRHLLVTFDANVSALRPSDPDWANATAELARERLNLAAADEAAGRWEGPEYALFRLTPRLPPVRPTAEDHHASRRAEPPPTSATTSGRKPWVLHRRGRHGRPLS